MEHTEPKHKPSPKHALDDVLSSLQDLMHNELNDAPPPATTAPATRRGGGKASANDVLSSLKGLIDGNGAGSAASHTGPEAELLEHDEPSRTELAIRRKMQNLETGASSGPVSTDNIEIEAVTASEYIDENIDDAIELTADDTAIEDIVEELEELPSGPDENEVIELSADAADAEEIELSAFAENDLEQLTVNAIEVEEILPTDATMEDQVDIIDDDAAPLFATDVPTSSDDSIDDVDTDDPDIPTLNTVEDIPTLKLEDGTPLSDMDPELNLPGGGSSETDLASPQHESGEVDLDKLIPSGSIPDINSSDEAAPDSRSADADLDPPAAKSMLELDDEISLDLDAPSDNSTLEGKKHKTEKITRTKKEPAKAKKSAPIPNDFVEKALQDIDDTLDYLSIKDDKPLPAETQSKPKPKTETKPRPELRQPQEKVVLKIDENTRPPKLEPGTPPDAEALRNNPFLQSQDEIPDETDNTITLSAQADDDKEQTTIRLEHSKADTTVKETVEGKNLSLDLPPIEPGLTQKKPQQAKAPEPKARAKAKPVKTKAKAKPAKKPAVAQPKAKAPAQSAKAKAKPRQGQARQTSPKKKTATQVKARTKQQKKPVIHRAKLAKNKRIGHQVEIDWDDIPVLDQNTNQIMTKTKEDKKAKVKTRDNGAKRAQVAQAPPGKSRKEKKVRDIAIKAIARLNIQLRKTGGQSLEPIMVDRLQNALKEVLDTPGTKGDNKPVKKK
jgi:hypothetical protein